MKVGRQAAFEVRRSLSRPLPLRCAGKFPLPLTLSLSPRLASSATNASNSARKAQSPLAALRPTLARRATHRPDRLSIAARSDCHPNHFASLLDSSERRPSAFTLAS